MQIAHRQLILMQANFPAIDLLFDRLNASDAQHAF
jgi:hypothetical protein